jgi:hypothetical protein
MEKSTQTEELSLTEQLNEINKKIDTIHAVIGYLLEHIKLLEKDVEGTVLD